jgi:ribosomal protein S18 acetylase RimI-like enzyme
MEIRLISQEDLGFVLEASHLFDGPAQLDATQRFLCEQGHHLLIAYEEGQPAGFVSGVEVTHPDKGTEMFLYELGVDEQFRRRGIGRALIERLKTIAQERGCYAMWVITGQNNAAALAAYESSGGATESGQVVVVWSLC